MSLRTVLASKLGRRGLGYREDPPDNRDFPAQRLFGVSPPPASASVLHPSVTPKDQGSSSACTGFSWSMALRMAYLRRGRDCPDLSASMIYYAARAEHGDTNVDAGSYLRSAAVAVMKFGAADEATSPFSLLRINSPPSFKAFHAAFDRRGMRGYFRIESGDTDGVRRAIASGSPVVGGWFIDQSFMDWNGRGAIGPQRGRKVGGHAVVLAEYAGATFSGPGSWGPSYGAHGSHVVTEEFVREGVDLWAVAV